MRGREGEEEKDSLSSFLSTHIGGGGGDGSHIRTREKVPYLKRDEKVTRFTYLFMTKQDMYKNPLNILKNLKDA